MIVHFISQDVTASVYSLNHRLGIASQYIVTDDPSLINVHWQIELHTVPGAISSIEVTIDRIIGNIEWTVDKDELPEDVKKQLLETGEEFNDTIEGKIKIDIDGKSKDWNIENKLTFESDGSISINIIEIDFADKMITIK